MRHLQLVTKDNCQKFDNPEDPKVYGKVDLLVPLTFVVPFAIFVGVWLGMFIGAVNIYSECFTKKQFSYDSFIMKKPLEVECKAK